MYDKYAPMLVKTGKLDIINPKDQVLKLEQVRINEELREHWVTFNSRFS